jgi:hypothetical protein
VRLLHATRIWQVRLAHVRIADVVIRAIRLAVRVLGSDVRRRGVREVIINCVRRVTSSGKSHARIQYNRLAHVARSTCHGALELGASEARPHTSRGTRRRARAVCATLLSANPA